MDIILHSSPGGFVIVVIHISIELNEFECVAGRVLIKKDAYVRERSFGSFERSFQVPEDVDTDKVSASFKKGVLTVMLPKSAQAQKAEKKIEVKAS